MQEKAFYKGGMDWTFQPAQDRGQRARWKAAGSAGRGVPLLILSLVNSGCHSVRYTCYGRQEKSGGPKTQRSVIGRRLSVCVFAFGSPCLCMPALSLVLLLLKSLKTSEVLCLYRRFSERLYSCI